MAALVFILGTLLGSFYLVVGTRVPKHENAITGRSKCDYCNHILRWYELIPIISFIVQRGKCNNCGKKISKDHLFLEIITGLLFLGGYFYYGLSLNYLTYLISISVTIIIFVSDLKYMIILDSPLVIGSIFIIVIRYFEIGFNGMLYSILCGILLFFVMFLIKKLGDLLFKKESLGGGDIKLCFLMGIILGYPHIGFRLGLISIVFASFLAFPYALGSLYLNKKNELPFGPFLISASVIIFIFIEKFSRLLVLFY